MRYVAERQKSSQSLGQKPPILSSDSTNDTRKPSTSRKIVAASLELSHGEEFLHDAVS